jgi:hypothetical protein
VGDLLALQRKKYSTPTLNEPRFPGRPVPSLITELNEVDGRWQMADWGRGYGATTPLHLGLSGTGPLCTAFSYARHLQRRSTSSDMRDLCL